MYRNVCTACINNMLSMSSISIFICNAWKPIPSAFPGIPLRARGMHWSSTSTNPSRTLSGAYGSGWGRGSPETGLVILDLEFDSVARLAFDFSAYGWSDRRISIAQLYFYWEVIWRPMAILNQFEVKKPIRFKFDHPWSGLTQKSYPKTSIWGGVDFGTGFNSTERTIKFMILYIIFIYGSVTIMWLQLHNPFIESISRERREGLYVLYIPLRYTCWMKYQMYSLYS